MRHLNKTLSIESSPHITSGDSVDAIMRNVVYALLPICVYAVYVFGLGVLLILVTAVVTCVLTEYWLHRSASHTTTVKDWSAVVTGLLFALTLPPNLPLWMVAVGGVVAIGMGKFLFGGLGANGFNPALVGRAFLQAAFPVAMTQWLPVFLPERFSVVPTSVLALPFAAPTYDGITSATPLSLFKFEHQPTAVADLFLGLSSGSLGETCSLLILLGGAWLVLRKIINWRIPASIFCTVGVLSAVLSQYDPSRFPSPLFMMFSGGLALGAVFMATDMVASPMTNLGVAVYGILIGILVVVIRLWAGMPEGVMYAILLSNAAAPHIDRLTQPRVFGQQSPPKVRS